MTWWMWAVLFFGSAAIVGVVLEEIDWRLKGGFR